MRNIFLCLIVVLLSTQMYAQSLITVGRYNEKSDPPYTVEGVISDIATGEVILGANVFIERQFDNFGAAWFSVDNSI